MTLENHVTNLKLSQRLKDLGVKQESVFGWRLRHVTDNGKIKNSGWVVWTSGFPEEFIGDESCSAFLASELGELLPVDTKVTKHEGSDDQKQVFWNCNVSGKIGYGGGKTMADIMAAALIYLLESKIITPSND